MSELSTVVEPTQVILPGQAIVSLERHDTNVTPYGNLIYSALFLNKESEIIKMIDEYSVFDFTYYLARDDRIRELVNNQTTTRKNSFVTSGFTPSDFLDLEQLFKNHRKAMEGIYMVSLRGGRINYI